MNMMFVGCVEELGTCIKERVGLAFFSCPPLGFLNRECFLLNHLIIYRSQKFVKNGRKTRVVEVTVKIDLYSGVVLLLRVQYQSIRNHHLYTCVKTQEYSIV